MKRGRAILAIGLAVMAGWFLFALALVGGFRLNLTPSEPLGLWRIEAPSQAIAVRDLVFVCPPQTPSSTKR